MQENIISKLFITNLFRFYFFRNKKIFRNILYYAGLIIISIAYMVIFFIKFNYIIENFSTSDYNVSIFSILIFIILIIVDFYLFAQFNNLFKQSKYGFFDEIAKTYPINSTETIEIMDSKISSKNSANSHLLLYDFTDIIAYYKYNKILIFQITDDNFIYFDTTKFDIKKLEAIIKEYKIKKRFILKKSKKDLVD